MDGCPVDPQTHPPFPSVCNQRSGYCIVVYSPIINITQNHRKIAGLIEIFNQEFVAGLADPTVRARFIEQGTEPAATTPEEFGKFIVTETAKWREVITKAGIPVITQ